jgi:acyl-lipid omega-6 desaturase (Delta-12 desaturase)
LEDVFHVKWRPMSTSPREGKALILATRPYAREHLGRSVTESLLTAALIALGLAATLGPTPWIAKVLLAAPVGLLLVRGFVLFHDHQHRALLHESKIARACYWLLGIFLLTPPRVWRDTHDYHHAHTAKLIGSHVGSYPTVSVAIWGRLSASERRRYALARHPLTILAAYLTIFLFGMCVQPLARNPRRHALEALLALGLHLSLCAVIGATLGAETLLLGFLLPMNVAFVFGAYLFYAQHNFEGIHLADRQDWEMTRAALHSSSYLELGPVMRWLTANIGYHHVHHLNARIPFYRLPEAMAELPELANPPVTTLRPRDVLASFRLKLWDPATGKMTGFPETSA